MSSSQFSVYLKKQFDLWESIDLLQDRNAIYIKDQKDLARWMERMQCQARKEKEHIIKLAEMRDIPVVLTEQPTNQLPGDKTSDNEFVHFMNEAEIILDGFDASIGKYGTWIGTSNDEELKKMQRRIEMFVENNRDEILTKKTQKKKPVFVYLLTIYTVRNLVDGVYQNKSGSISSDKNCSKISKYLESFSIDSLAEIENLPVRPGYKKFISSNTSMKELTKSDSIEQFRKQIQNLERVVDYFFHCNDELIAKLKMEKYKDLWKLNQMMVDLAKEINHFLNDEDEEGTARLDKLDNNPRRIIDRVKACGARLARFFRLSKSASKQDNGG